jgi:hypothetical protein
MEVDEPETGGLLHAVSSRKLTQKRFLNVAFIPSLYSLFLKMK